MKLSSDETFSDYYSLLDTDQNGSISLAEIEENYARIYREVGKTKVSNIKQKETAKAILSRKNLFQILRKMSRTF